MAQSAQIKRNMNVQLLDYYTSPIDFFKFAEKYVVKDAMVWESSAGNGKVSEPLKGAGYEVYSSDVYDYGYPLDEVEDFYAFGELPHPNIRTILTNPPYKGAQTYIEHSLKLLENKGDRLVLLLRLDFLTSQARGKFFKQTGQLKHVDIFSYRIKCLKDDIDDGTSSAVNYQIFVWEVGYEGQPQIDWITK